jgi:hypothetical protein
MHVGKDLLLHTDPSAFTAKLRTVLACLLPNRAQLVDFMMRRLKRFAALLEREPLELVLARPEVARAARLLGFGILCDPLRVEVLHSVTSHATNHNSHATTNCSATNVQACAAR